MDFIKYSQNVANPDQKIHQKLQLVVLLLIIPENNKHCKLYDIFSKNSIGKIVDQLFILFYNVICDLLIFILKRFTNIINH